LNRCSMFFQVSNQEAGEDCSSQQVVPGESTNRRNGGSWREMTRDGEYPGEGRGNEVCIVRTTTTTTADGFAVPTSYMAWTMHASFAWSGRPHITSRSGAFSSFPKPFFNSLLLFSSPSFFFTPIRIRIFIFTHSYSLHTHQLVLILIAFLSAPFFSSFPLGCLTCRSVNRHIKKRCNDLFHTANWRKSHTRCLPSRSTLSNKFTTIPSLQAYLATRTCKDAAQPPPMLITKAAAACLSDRH